MPIGMTIVLGAFAGLTIYLGLPLAFIRNTSQSLKTFLSMLATGVLIFLLYDVISQASEPISDAMDRMREHTASPTTFFIDITLLALGLWLGLLGLVYFNKYVIKGLLKRMHARTSSATAPTSTDLTPQLLSLVIAIGIGLHNFSEGLAIGQSAARGALQLATVLIIGFGLHNMTEGFGIAGPLADQSVSWKFVALTGLIGGGPTFLGTVIGTVFQSPQVFIFCLALAAGAILYVVAELLGVAKRSRAQEVIMWGLLAGFFLGYASDLIVSYAGA